MSLEGSTAQHHTATNSGSSSSSRMFSSSSTAPSLHSGSDLKTQHAVGDGVISTTAEVMWWQIVARLHCLSMNEVSCDPLLVSFRLHPLPVLYTVHCTQHCTVHLGVLYTGWPQAAAGVERWSSGVLAQALKYDFGKRTWKLCSRNATVSYLFSQKWLWMKMKIAFSKGLLLNP